MSYNAPILPAMTFAQYIIRNPFSEQKMTYNEENGTVIYRSRMHAKTKRNFEIFSAEEFIASITQHIPEKGFQTRLQRCSTAGRWCGIMVGIQTVPGVSVQRSR